MAKVILPTLRYSQSPKTIRVQSRKDCVDGEGEKKERKQKNRKHIASRVPSSHHVKLGVCFIFSHNHVSSNQREAPVYSVAASRSSQTNVPRPQARRFRFNKMGSTR